MRFMIRLWQKPAPLSLGVAHHPSSYVRFAQRRFFGSDTARRGARQRETLRPNLEAMRWGSHDANRFGSHTRCALMRK